MNEQTCSAYWRAPSMVCVDVHWIDSCKGAWINEMNERMRDEWKNELTVPHARSAYVTGANKYFLLFKNWVIYSYSSENIKRDTVKSLIPTPFPMCLVPITPFSFFMQIYANENVYCYPQRLGEGSWDWAGRDFSVHASLTLKHESEPQTGAPSWLGLRPPHLACVQGRHSPSLGRDSHVPHFLWVSWVWQVPPELLLGGATPS